jgi:hypothetical protein
MYKQIILATIWTRQGQFSYSYKNAKTIITHFTTSRTPFLLFHKNAKTIRTYFTQSGQETDSFHFATRMLNQLEPTLPQAGQRKGQFLLCHKKAKQAFSIGCYNQEKGFPQSG